MEYNSLFREAKKELGLGEHIFSVVLPFLKDNKVLFNVLEHLHSAVLFSIRSFLQMKKEQKGLRIIPESNLLARQLFFEMYMDELKFSALDEKMISEITSILNAHKKNMAELKRGLDNVIVLPDYNTITLNEIQVKKYLNYAKDFVFKTEKGLV
jgi:hypothetical protein